VRLHTDLGEVALVVVDGDASGLHPDERAHARALSDHRAREWIAGRRALRMLLGEVGPIMSDDRGAPIAPAGHAASVSHKGALAAALVTRDTGWHIGLDLELAQPSRHDIGSRILTAREQAQIRAPREVTRSFSIKEAIYKAVDPFVRRYVGFLEVELAFDPLVVTSALPLAIEASWLEHDGYWISTARARGR
jgi:enterobactin synthetase component D